MGKNPLFFLTNLEVLIKNFHIFTKIASFIIKFLKIEIFLQIICFLFKCIFADKFTSFTKTILLYLTPFCYFIKEFE